MITLEPIHERFIPDIQSTASLPEVQRTTLLPSPYPEDGARTFVAIVRPLFEAGEAFPYVILLDGVFIGMTGITRIDWETRTGEAGYWLHPKVWGRGFATETLRQITEIGFRDVDLDRIIAHILQDNTASRRVAEKAGFRYVRDFMETSEKFYGKTSTEYEMLREDWERMQEAV